MNRLRLFGRSSAKREQASPTAAQAAAAAAAREKGVEDEDGVRGASADNKKMRRSQSRADTGDQQASGTASRGLKKASQKYGNESDDGGSGSSDDSDEDDTNLSSIQDSSDDECEDLVDINDDDGFFSDKPTSAQLEQERAEIVRTNFEVLCAVPFFSRFPEEHQRRLFAELRVEHYNDGDRIVTQGDNGDRMYIIVNGEAVVWREDVGEITHIYTHDYFGEQSILFSQARNSNVSAVGRTTVMYLSKEAFDKYENIRVFMIVQKIPLLSKLRPDMQTKIVNRLRPVAFEKGEFVVTQGEVGDAFYMIAKGSAEVVENGEVTTHLYEGHTFGQMALMSGAPRLASIRASESLICMELKAKDFQALMAEDSEFSQILQTDDKVIRRRRSKRDARRNKPRNASIDSGPSRRYSVESSSLSLSQSVSGNKLVDETSVVNARRKGGHRIVNGFVLRREIGRGTFGRVRLCVHEKTGEEFAIKIIDKSKIKDNVSVHAPGLEEMRQEVAIMKRLRHPNIVNLVAVIDDPADDHLYIVTEYCENGALMEGLDNNQPLPENTAREYFRDLLLGLHYLHAQGVVHRDIKPANLLLTKENVVKIADFGAARMITGGTKWISGVTGTPAFMAPELLVEDQEEYDGPAVDLWSCGATLFMMVTGTPPWMSDDEIKLAKKVKNDELQFPHDWNQSNYSPHLKNLIQRLLSKDPLKRPVLEEVMNHEWVTEEGSELLMPIAEDLAHSETAEVPAPGQPSTFLTNFDNGTSVAPTKEEQEAAIDQLQARDSLLAMTNFSPNSSMSAARSNGGEEDLDELLKIDVVIDDDDEDLNSDDESEYSQQTSKYDIGRMNKRHQQQQSTGATKQASIQEICSDKSHGGLNDDDDDDGAPPPSIPMFGTDLPKELRGGKKVAWTNIRYASSKEQNNRASMEDCISICSKLTKPGQDSWFSSSKSNPVFFAAVYDGHGGSRVSELLKESLHRTIAAQETFTTDLQDAIYHGCLEFDRTMLQKAATMIMDQKAKVKAGEARQSLLRTKGDRAADSSAVEEYRKAGSTALLAFVGEDKSFESGRFLTVAWVGDSRAVLSRGGKSVQLSEDHKASREDETQRIRKAGGTVNRKGQVDGSLAVSRSFGDIMHKGLEIETLANMKPSGPSPKDDELLEKGIVIPAPELYTDQILPSDEFIIMASDGLWDTVSNQDAVNIVAHALKEKNDIQYASDRLMKQALVQSVDNISIVIISLR